MRDIERESRENLELLIERFNMGAVSAFVGAGFSQNANKDFPDWNQLVDPMIDKIYPLRDRKSVRMKKDYLRIAEDYEYSKSRKKLDKYIKDTLEPYDKKETNNLELHKKLLSLEWNDIFTTNYDTLLEQADTVERYKVIEEFTAILNNAVSKRIIKLHGSLSNKNKEFDGCKQKYIITQTDYNTYHEKHKGFTTVVQSQIAQNSLCLIGFSGDDHNFKNWIRWLSSLIPASNKNIEPNPIFFIDVADKFSLDKEKEKLYIDHNIKVVFIKDILESIKPINSFTKQEIEKIAFSFPYYDRLYYFFNYISTEVILSRDYPHIPINAKINYDIEFYIGLSQILDIKEVTKLLIEYSPFFDLPRIPSGNTNELAPRGTHALQNIKVDDLSLLDYYTISILIMHIMQPISSTIGHVSFQALIDKITTFDLKKITEQEKIAYKAFMLLALKEYRFIGDPKSFEKLASIIKEKTENWDMNEEIENFINYEECLFCANCFDIEGLHKKLDDWNIDNCKEVKWYIKKAFLFNIFGYNTESTKLIEKALAVKTENFQEKLWLLEIADIYSFFERKTIDIRQKEIEALKQKKYYTLENLTGYLIEKITEAYNGKQDQKESPVDEKRNKGRSITHAVNQPERSIVHYKVSLLYLFEEMGINIKTDHIYWYNLNENVTNVLIESFTEFYIYIHSAFGYDSSENLARKVCQNIIFNKNTDTKDIKYLFDGLFRILKYKIKNDKNARIELFPLSEFIRRLKYDDWKELVEFLTEKLEDTTANNQVINLFLHGNMWGWKKPFEKICPLIEDEEIIKKFILFFLKMTQGESNIERDDSIGYFYILQQNCLYEKAITSIFADDDFLDENINNNSLLFIYKSVFFYRYLKKEAQEKIINEVLEIEKNINDKIFLLSFTEDEEIVNVLKKYIIEDLSNFSILRYPTPQYHHIYKAISNKISEDDKIIIFEKLKGAFECSKEDTEKKKKSSYYESTNKSTIANSFLILYQLLAMEKDFLCNDNDFNIFFQDVQNYYFENFTELDNWKDIILSGDEDEFKLFSNRFLYLFNYLEYENYYNILNSILQRIIFKDSFHHEAIINNIAGVLSRMESTNDFLKEPLLNTLLYKFQINISNIHDRIFVEQNMVYIALILNKNGIDNDQVKYWLDYKEKSEFKEVQNVLLIN